MQAGEVGVVITIKAEVALVGSTTELHVRGPGDPQPRALSTTTAGINAQRSTEAADFPVEGNYLLQLISTFPGAKVLKSPIKQIFVGGRLD